MEKKRIKKKKEKGKEERGRGSQSGKLQRAHLI